MESRKTISRNENVKCGLKGTRDEWTFILGKGNVVGETGQKLGDLDTIWIKLQLY